MKLEVKLDGLDKLEKELNKVYKNLVSGTNLAITDVAENIRQVAKDKAPSTTRQQLKKSISISESSNGTFNKSRVYIDTSIAPYAKYVYFGTIGVWWVGESKLKNSSKELMDVYAYYSYVDEETGDTVWQVKGQEPKMFLEEAIETTESQNIDIAKSTIAREIKKG